MKTDIEIAQEAADATIFARWLQSLELKRMIWNFTESTRQRFRMS